MYCITTTSMFSVNAPEETFTPTLESSLDLLCRDKCTFSLPYKGLCTYPLESCSPAFFGTSLDIGFEVSTWFFLYLKKKNNSSSSLAGSRDYLSQQELFGEWNKAKVSQLWALCAQRAGSLTQFCLCWCNYSNESLDLNLTLSGKNTCFKLKGML